MKIENLVCWYQFIRRKAILWLVAHSDVHKFLEHDTKMVLKTFLSTEFGNRRRQTICSLVIYAR